MQSKEVKKWQDEEALKRYQMIAPLLDEELDEAKRRQLREEIAARYEISKRSLYRYEAKYQEEAFDGLRPMNRERDAVRYCLRIMMRSLEKQSS